MATAQEQDVLRSMILTFRVNELQMLLGNCQTYLYTILLIKLFVTFLAQTWKLLKVTAFIYNDDRYLLILLNYFTWFDNDYGLIC